ncbi:MAG TPA: hypothetical protein VMJ13_00155 [Candidatus Acidoferrum sp.]|nr:hypothetical protein [Candidatus Acidoferrum sp.]
MESLERFAQNELIIQEYVSQWLAPMPSDFGRLADVAMLRDVTAGRYHHPALEEIYPQPAVHQALLYCHEELFQRVVEMPPERQEWDLRIHFASMTAPVEEIASRWLELEYFRSLVPLGTTPYLRDLFLTNTRSILNLVVRERTALAATA